LTLEKKYDNIPNIMKYIPIICLFFLCITGCNQYPVPSADALNIHTLGDIAEYANKHIEYRADAGIEEFRSVGKTYYLKYGDCDDSTIFVAYYAHCLGYKTYMLCLYNGGRYGHVICLIEKNGMVGYIENGNYIPAIFDDVDKIIGYYSKYYSREDAYRYYFIFPLTFKDDDFVHGAINLVHKFDFNRTPFQVVAFDMADMSFTEIDALIKFRNGEME
jgi:hypothetical protein